MFFGLPQNFSFCWAFALIGIFLLFLAFSRFYFKKAFLRALLAPGFFKTKNALALVGERGVHKHQSSWWIRSKKVEQIIPALLFILSPYGHPDFHKFVDDNFRKITGGAFLVFVRTVGEFSLYRNFVAFR